MVFEHVPGIRLADDQGAPVPGYPLHTFFREFERAEREKIRDEFDKNYPTLTKFDWSIYETWADRLVWNPVSSKLYVPSMLTQSCLLTIWIGGSSISER
ncbi:hypothetical protein ACN38_g5555 [Penicillium nordicum]|uniref:Uncharacterized protein n=1 Tax=Penicillium nordicum TaxID=229535 RepID=A0A0M8P4S3_9EURO|nr:hypothetical protein ACN38_g5555 [Penicillium nordicum]